MIASVGPPPLVEVESVLDEAECQHSQLFLSLAALVIFDLYVVDSKDRLHVLIDSSRLVAVADSPLGTKTMAVMIVAVSVVEA